MPKETGEKRAKALVRGRETNVRECEVGERRHVHSKNTATGACSEAPNPNTTATNLYVTPRVWRRQSAAPALQQIINNACRGVWGKLHTPLVGADDSYSLV